MRSITVFAASYLIFVMAALFAGLWLFATDRHGKIAVAVAGAVGLAAAWMLIALASHLHTDPRPFAQDITLHPLIPHKADNGFPSDHSGAAALMAGIALWRWRLWGATLAAGAVVVAAGRLGAHVHHLQDVVAGLAIGLAAAAIGMLAATRSATPARKSVLKPPRRA
jgi:membrane-associated phospholipid phosphatase